ncbi:MAG: alpha/beta hydrolase [Neptuniibacter sp.]
MKKFTLSLFYLGSICYLSLCAVLYFYQDNLLYFPRDRVVPDPAKTLLLPTGVGETVVTTEIKDNQKALIYFGGNAEDVSRNLESFQATFPGYSLFLMHYRGYGGSDGEPGEEGLYQDARALYDHVNQSHEDIVLIGRSLGSGVATRLAAETLPDKLILITPFSSVEDVASEIYWGFPVSLLLKDKYLSWQYAKQVQASTSIIVATDDKVIPMHSSMKLFDSFKPGLAQVYELDKANHNNISSHSEYHKLLKRLTQ